MIRERRGLYRLRNFPASKHEQLVAEERTERIGIPVTTVERTLVDLLASHGVTEQTKLAVAQALERGLTTAESLRTTARGRSKATLGRVEQAMKRFQT